MSRSWLPAIVELRPRGIGPRPARIGMVSSIIEPFHGFIPTPEAAPRIVGPPRSMLTAEQIEAAERDPLSFRHAVGRGAHASAERARRWLADCRSAGAVRAVGPSVLIHRIWREGFVATGIIAEVLVDDSSRVRPHEATIAKTEAKMATYMEASRIFGNPLTLAHRPDAVVAEAIAARTQSVPDCDFVCVDGSSHALWTIDGRDAEALCSAFRATLYVIDGHHRLAAACDVARAENQRDPRMPAGIFSVEELQLRSHARLISDPELDGPEVVARLSSRFRLEAVDCGDYRPRRRGEFGVTVGERCYRLTLDAPESAADPLAVLDVALLQELVLGPVFGIVAPRYDRRLRFVADRPGHGVEEHDALVSFLPHPLSVDEVLHAADLGRTMPPKSTSFSPKLPSGLVIRLRDQPTGPPD